MKDHRRAGKPAATERRVIRELGLTGQGDSVRSRSGGDPARKRRPLHRMVPSGYLLPARAQRVSIPSQVRMFLFNRRNDRLLNAVFTSERNAHAHPRLEALKTLDPAGDVRSTVV